MPKTKFNFTKSNLDALSSPTEKSRVYYYDAKARGLGIRITSNGVKSFIAYRWVNGKPERQTLGRYPELTIEQARGKAAEFNAAIARGENPNDKRRRERSEITLGTLFNEYLDRHAKLHKRSWKEDQNQFRRYLLKWKNRKLSSISRSDIHKLHQHVSSEHGTYAANRTLALLSILFSKAMEFGLWDKMNPTHGIKKFKEYSRERFLQAAELPRFFQSLAAEQNEDIRDYVLLSLLTGARRNNVLAMQWEQINFEHQEWRIPQTKNGTSQLIPLSEESLAILQNRYKMKQTEFVFPGIGKTGHLMEPKKGWSRILARANIHDLRIHDLRRTLGSWQAKTGASTVIIGKSLNHKSPSATAIYARLDTDPVRHSVKRATEAMLAFADLKENSLIFNQ